MNFKITGGEKLSGEVTINRSKNAAVALLCASLLNRGRTTLKKVPKIEEVYRVIETLESIGVKVVWQGADVVITPPPKLAINKLNKEAAMKTRSVIMLLGPLIHHFKTFQLPHPGGCKLGARTVRPHIYALERLGVKIESKSNHYEVRADKLRARDIVLYEAGDTVTENALMAASLIPGQTQIKYATANYMVQDLCRFLELLGVKIEGIGSSTLTINGLKEIKQDVEFTLSEDPIEAMLFLALAATTNSTLTIRRAPINFLELELLKLEKMGFKYKLSQPYLSENGFTKLVDIETRPSRLRALEEKIHPLPYPGINIDNLPFFVPIATQARGTTLIHDWVYENRAIYYYEMTKLGANVILADPHRLIIEGPTPLRGTEIICPPALRPAAIILIGMLAARGNSLLRNVYSINRGYENLVERLQKLGAKIEIVDSPKI
jgi:UDP-N-acetylglucosamine 1-carboxyvinyltransferase